MANFITGLQKGCTLLEARYNFLFFMPFPVREISKRWGRFQPLVAPTLVEDTGWWRIGIAEPGPESWENFSGDHTIIYHLPVPHCLYTRWLKYMETAKYFENSLSEFFEIWKSKVYIHSSGHAPRILWDCRHFETKLLASVPVVCCNWSTNGLLCCTEL